MRKARQDSAFRKLIRDLKEEVLKSYKNKVLHDAYYERKDFKEEVY